MNNIPRTPPSNSFHVIAPLVPPLPGKFVLAGKRRTPNRVFFQKFSQSLCLLPISLYQSRFTNEPSRAEKKDRLEGNRFLESNPPLRGNRFNRLASVAHLSPRRLLSRRNEPKSKEGGREKGEVKNIHGESRKKGEERGVEKLDACNGREETRFSGLPRNSLAENRRGRECYTLSSHEREVRVEG